MSPEDITPKPEGETAVDVTVSVPAHRVEQFHRFHARFLEIAARWDARIGSEDLFRRGRGGPGRHGGRCGGHRKEGRHGRPEWAAGPGPETPPETA